MIAYLAHPIDYAVSGRLERVLQVRLALEKLGYWVYHPAMAWSVFPGTEPDPTVQKANLDVLLRADLVVALLWQDTLAIGTILELVQAWGDGKEAVIISDIRRSVSTELRGVPIFECLTTGLRNGEHVRVGGLE